MDTTIRSGSGSHAPGRQLAPTFVHLKVHSAYSLLEGAITFPRLAKLAAAQGSPPHALEFYRKLGYTLIGVVPDANGYGNPDILMAKRL